MLDFYMREVPISLPTGYDVSEFSDMFLAPDPTRELQDTFADLFLFERESFTWVKGIVPFVQKLWAAELDSRAAARSRNPAARPKRGFWNDGARGTSATGQALLTL
jgi:hypothetical protein